MTRFLTAVVVPTLAILAGRALADHGGPLRAAPMSPLLLALISGAAALAAGVLIVIIVMALTRKGRE
jgi:hypothetical protein